MDALPHTLADEDAPALFGPRAPAQAEPSQSAVIQITLNSQGQLSVRGPRAAVVELLVACARRGLVIKLDDLNWCG